MNGNKNTTKEQYLKNILNFQNDAIDYLYDMPIGNDSLFMAEFSTDNANHKDHFKNAKYRIKKIEFSTPKLKYEKDDHRRQQTIVGLERDYDVKITWYEDAFNSIEKVTLDLMHNLVDFNTGLFKVGGGQTSSQLTIYRYTYINENSNAISPLDIIPVPKCTGIIEFSGLKPKGFGSITLDSSSGGDIKTIDVEYSYSRCIYRDITDAMSGWNADDFIGLTSPLIQL